MSGKMQRAIFSISCCGMPELLMSFLRLPKIVLLRALAVDYEGVLGVFEIKTQIPVKYLRGVLAVFDCENIIRTSIEPVKASNHH